MENAAAIGISQTVAMQQLESCSVQLSNVLPFNIALLWRTLLTLLVGLAIAVSSTTVLLSMLPSVNDVVTQAIEARTGFRADIGSLEG